MDRATIRESDRTAEELAALNPMDERSILAGMVGVSEAGLYVPGNPEHEARKASIGTFGTGGRS